MTAFSWRVVSTHVLDGTTLELWPLYVGGWSVVDTRSERQVGSALELPKAKALAERLAETGRYRKEVG